MPDYTHAKKIITALENGKNVQFYYGPDWQRSSLVNNQNSNTKLTEINNPAMYRVEPEPKLIPLSQEDIPPVCWVRRIDENKDDHWLVHRVKPHVIQIGSVLYNYENLFKSFEYSTDRKNWKPCSKESV